jgi:lambda repressor-like predicted transcriptional regulator
MVKNMVSAIFVNSPEKELEILVALAQKGDQIDWKPAIILAAAYLEKFGIELLKKHFEKRKIQLSGKLEGLSLNDVTTFLYGLSLIDEKFFTWMTEIWKERISIVHQRETLPAYVGDEANKKYGKVIANTLEIIAFLKR